MMKTPCLFLVFDANCPSVLYTDETLLEDLNLRLRSRDLLCERKGFMDVKAHRGEAIIVCMGKMRGVCYKFLLPSLITFKLNGRGSQVTKSSSNFSKAGAWTVVAPANGFESTVPPAGTSQPSKHSSSLCWQEAQNACLVPDLPCVLLAGTINPCSVPTCC